jgi:hypothetical protein
MAHPVSFCRTMSPFDPDCLPCASSVQAKQAGWYAARKPYRLLPLHNQSIQLIELTDNGLSLFPRAISADPGLGVVNALTFIIRSSFSPF